MRKEQRKIKGNQITRMTGSEDGWQKKENKDMERGWFERDNRLEEIQRNEDQESN